MWTDANINPIPVVSFKIKKYIIFNPWIAETELHSAKTLVEGPEMRFWNMVNPSTPLFQIFTLSLNRDEMWLSQSRLDTK